MTVVDAPLWPFAVYLGVVLLLVAAVIVVSYPLGQHHHARTTGEPFESGSPPTGSARLRFSVGFYLVAMFFVVFDVESIFIFAWAIAWRDVGWGGYIEVVIFVGILMAALVYLWRLGALDWRADGRRKDSQAKERAHGVS